MPVTPVLLMILDGFGYGEPASDNAISQANTPNWDRLWQTCPHMLINASENFVGLPGGQMGNSEVGHLNIGAGRVVYQELERINQSVATGDFFQHPVLLEAMAKAQHNHAALHVLGLISDGGIHSHDTHIHALLCMAAQHKLSSVYVHAFLDGRDTPPKSAERYLQTLQTACEQAGVGRIASITGRFYAMDRDKRWPRVETAWQLLVEGKAPYEAANAITALHQAYERGETDEFVQATRIGSACPVEDGDVLVYMNFRSDRARQLTQAFLDDDFHGFARPRRPKLGGYYTLTPYSQDTQGARAVFLPEAVRNSLGEYVSTLGYAQLRIAETEKYPHVTFFFNGGEERMYPGEDRIMVPSPQVATYDLQPEMSAYQVTDQLVSAIEQQKYQLIICNYANADMVGHTGNLSAAIAAIEALDHCIGRVVSAMQRTGGEMIITADHGNAECMMNHADHQPHTQHTTNRVPFVYVGRPATLASTGSLCDLAPSLLCLMGLPKPAEMTGNSLVTLL